MHTHFASATTGLAAFLSVVIFGTLWRLVAMHSLTSSSPAVRGVAKAMLFQY